MQVTSFTSRTECSVVKCLGCSVTQQEFYESENPFKTFFYRHSVLPCHEPHIKKLVFRCQKKNPISKRQCKTSITLLKGSFFEKSHLSLEQVSYLVLLYLNHPFPRHRFISEEMNLAAQTVTDWFSFIREVFIFWVDQQSSQIGGQGEVVEIDEAKKNKLFRKKSLSDLTMMENNLPCNRMFLMEAPCAMSPAQMSMNVKPRHLFLFSDLLLIAKPRSMGSFKLKESIRVSEMWIARCAESETGFLLGWPSPARTYLVTFCTQAARDSWWRELRRALSAQLRLEPPITNIKVVYRDPLSGTECSKTLGVGPETTSTDVARLALDESRTCDTSFTLYTRDRDNASCPLIGCERPHSIQLARLRQSLCAEEGFDLTHCNKSRIPCDIVFELRPTIDKLRTKKTPLKLFRKSSTGRVFGVALSRLCPNSTLPPVISTCLKTLFQQGPQTQGIFRRCASARALRELKEKVDSQGAAVCEEISRTPALLLGALLKDFLRSLPEPLLAGSAQEWLNAATSGRLDLLRRLLSNLPRENHMLLRYVVCMLNNIAKKSRFNLMSAANLGVCVGPSMLWESAQNAPLRTLPTLIEMLISNCQTLFGSQIVSLLGEVANDSGAEESDSLHSLGLSLDSVELSKDQKSLSRDSGLTLSEDDRESPGLNYHTATFHRSDWARQAARIRSMDNTTSWIEEDEAFCASNESLCSPPIPPRRPPPLRHLPPVHIPPLYRPPPPPPPTYATARLLLVTDAESESYV